MLRRPPTRARRVALQLATLAGCLFLGFLVVTAKTPEEQAYQEQVKRAEAEAHAHQLYKISTFARSHGLPYHLVLSLRDQANERFPDSLHDRNVWLATELEAYLD